jgi:glycosyltransferase involved in cell wall biosynthesis
MSVTVVIPAYNSARFLAAAIDSVLAQSLLVDQLVIVNDGSTDDTDRVVGAFGDSVEYIHQPNSGVSAARNRGLAVARGDLVLFLDADDCLHRDAMSHLLPHAAGGTAVSFGDSDVVDLAGNWLGYLSRPQLAGAPPSTSRWIFEKWSGHPPSNFLVPTWAAREVGGFDPRFSYCADSFFLMQLGTVVSFVHVPEVVLKYRQHDANMSQDVRTSVKDLIDTHLAFLDWLSERGRNDVIVDPPTTLDLFAFLASRSFYTREWRVLEETLALASIRNIQSPALRRFGRLSRLPGWLFWVQDLIDGRRAR